MNKGTVFTSLLVLDNYSGKFTISRNLPLKIVSLILLSIFKTIINIFEGNFDTRPKYPVNRVEEKTAPVHEHYMRQFGFTLSSKMAAKLQL